MEIKMKAIGPLIGIYERVKNISLPIRTTYKLDKLFREIKDSNEFYRTEMLKIIDEYAERDENGNPKPTPDGNGISIKNEDVEAAHSKIDDLWDINVELPDITFTIDELEGLGLTLEDIEIFNPFIQSWINS